MISQELITAAVLLLISGLNDCCWSFVLKVDTLSIVFVNFSDVCLLQTFLLPSTALKMSPVLTFSQYFTYQLPHKEY